MANAAAAAAAAASGPAFAHVCRTPDEQAIRTREQNLHTMWQQAGFNATFWDNKQVQDEHQAICVMLFANTMANPQIDPPYPSLFGGGAKK